MTIEWLENTESDRHLKAFVETVFANEAFEIVVRYGTKKEFSTFSEDCVQFLIESTPLRGSDSCVSCRLVKVEYARFVNPSITIVAEKPDVRSYRAFIGERR